jgi:hypothetical protein
MYKGINLNQVTTSQKPLIKRDLKSKLKLNLLIQFLIQKINLYDIGLLNLYLES